MASISLSGGYMNQVSRSPHLSCVQFARQHHLLTVASPTRHAGDEAEASPLEINDNAILPAGSIYATGSDNNYSQHAGGASSGNSRRKQIMANNSAAAASHLKATSTKRSGRFEGVGQFSSEGTPTLSA